MAVRVPDLAQLHRDAGLHVVVVAGYQTRARPGAPYLSPEFVTDHHTAGHNDLQTVIRGRPDLAGPLANLYNPKDGSQVIVAQGRASHAGKCSGTVINAIRSNIAPSGSAASRHLSDTVDANPLSYGRECENYGDGVDPWPEEQLNTMALSDALLCRHHGWGYQRVVAHFELTARKVDPRFVAPMTMPAYREKVRWLLSNVGPVPEPGPRSFLIVRHDPKENDDTMEYTLDQLDPQGKGQWFTGIPYTRFKSVQAFTPVRPYADGRYPDRSRPGEVIETFPSEDDGKILVAVVGGEPGGKARIFLNVAAP